jgi:hypothetical protein
VDVLDTSRNRSRYSLNDRTNGLELSCLLLGFPVLAARVASEDCMNVESTPQTAAVATPRLRTRLPRQAFQDIAVEKMHPKSTR